MRRSGAVYGGQTSRTYREEVRNAVFGQKTSLKTARKLRDMTRNPHWRERIGRKTAGAKAYADLMTAWPLGLTGRLGRPVYRGEVPSAESLELVDEVMKRLSYEVVAAGFDLVGVAGDEFVVETPEEQPAAEQLAALANHTAESILGGVARDCCCCRVRVRW